MQGVKAFRSQSSIPKYPTVAYNKDLEAISNKPTTIPRNMIEKNKKRSENFAVEGGRIEE